MTTVGTTPWAMVARRPDFLLAFAVLGALVCWLAVRDYTSAARQHPSFLEFVAGGVGLLTQSAGAALVGIGCGWVLRALGKLVNAGLDRTSWDWRIPLDALFLWSSAFLVFLMLLGMGPLSQNLARQLYPQTAGVASAFFDHVYGRRRNSSLLVLGGLVVAAAVWLAVFIFWRALAHNVGFNLVLAAGLMMMARLVAEAGEGTQTQEGARAEDAVKKLFEGSGYFVVAAPRTGDPAVDPLLVNVDLYAGREEQAFLLQVHSAVGDGSASVRELKDLSTAAWALNQKLGEIAAEAAEPLLIVFGAQEVDRAFLASLGEREGVRVAALPPELTAAAILAKDDENELREITAGLDVKVFETRPPKGYAGPGALAK